MNELKEIFTADWQSIIVVIFCIIATWDKLVELKDKFCERYGIRTNISDKNQMIYAHSERIEHMGVQLTTINDKINVFSQMFVELQQTVEELRQEKRKDQLSIIGDRLFQAYSYYKNRADEIGKCEWTCVEKAGFYSIMDNYHDNGGDTYSHSVIEPYMRQFKIIDPENANPDDIYFDR